MLMGIVNSCQPVQDILLFVVALLRFYAEYRSLDDWVLTLSHHMRSNILAFHNRGDDCIVYHAGLLNRGIKLGQVGEW